MTFELTILGSSSAIPTSEKYPTSQVLNVLERFFLIDCGEGTQIRLRQMRFSFDRIRHAFISHLHGDHFLGLPGLISTRNLLGCKTDFHIYAHEHLKNLIQPLLDNMKGEMGFEVVFHPLNFRQPEKIFADKKAEVYSFPLKHSVPCCGFLFREKAALPNIRKEKILEHGIPVRQIPSIKEGAGFINADGVTIPHEELTLPPHPPRSYAFCTDTSYFEPALETVSGVDLLYHEATFLQNLTDWAAKTSHSTAAQAATFALKAQAKKLILGHFSTRYKKTDPFLEEARRVFPATELATDGSRFSVDWKNR